MEEPYEPNLSDFAFFLSVMKVKEAHRDILSIILDEDDIELVELEENQEIVEKICAIAASYAPDYDCDKVCREWEKKE